MGKYASVVGLATAIICLDQFTKWLVVTYVPAHAVIEVVPGFAELTHVKNTGGAFGFLAGADDAWRLPFFIVVSLVAMGLLWQVVRSTDPKEFATLFAVGSVLGGAVGNFIDRAREGAVTDFISLHWREYYWPAFNVADSFITIGVAVLVWQSVWGHRKEPSDG